MNKLKVDGMHCQNCVKAVTEAVSALPGAKGVEVSLEKGEVIGRQWASASTKSLKRSKTSDLTLKNASAAARNNS